MLISVVSDVHGNFDDLGRVADGADFLIVLGDLLEYVDYHDHGAGILGTIFGAEAVGTFAELRIAGQFDEMHAYDRRLWSTLADPAAALHEVVNEQYERVVGLLGPDTLVTLGNVDMPSVWAELAPSHLRCRDGEALELDGVRFGFVAGGALKQPVPGSPWAYHERSHISYRDAVDRVGPVDVLCSHVPPGVENLRFDIEAKRHEMYGPGLLEAIEQHTPAMAVFGHVHHPRVAEMRVGSTLCVNVGFFKRGPTPFVFDTQTLRQR